MPISITCPGCESTESVSDELLGKTVKCKKCGELVEIRAPRVTSGEKTASPPKPAAPAKTTPAKAAPAAARRNDDEEDAPQPARRSRRRDEDDDDDRRGNKKSKSPVALIMGVAAAMMVFITSGIGGFMFFGGGGDKDNDNDEVAALAPDRDPVNMLPEPGNPAMKKADNPANAAAKPATKVAVASKNDDDVVETEPANPKDTKAAPKVDPKDEVKTPPAVTTVAAATPLPVQQPTTSSGMSKDRYLTGRMDPLVSSKVKQASVFVKVETNSGGGTGSGWFGMEQNLVFTNAHVLSMLAPNSPEPKKITLILNAGTPEQREIPPSRIKILAVDRNIDLALMQVVNEKDLPEPLKVRPSIELLDGQGLNTIGFPFGQNLSSARSAPEISVRPTTFTAFRRNDFGELRRIQLEGGINPGNSGGPIVDAEGVVMGVTVEVFQKGGAVTGIAAAVPAEYCFGILNGRIAEIEYGTPYRDAGKVKIPVKAKCLDPLGRFLGAGIKAWIGDSKDKIRMPGKTAAPSLPSDAGMTDVALKYDAKTKEATGELVMPELTTGRAYFAQPYYTHPLNSQPVTSFMAGLKIPMTGPAVDRTPTDLYVKLKPGTSREVKMTNSQSVEENEVGEGGGKNDRVAVSSKLVVNETVMPPDNRDTVQAARLRLKFVSLEPKVELDGGIVEEDILPKSIMARLNSLMTLAEAVGLVHRTGEMYKYQINVLAIPNPLEQRLTLALADQSLEALLATSIPLPNKKVNPNESWKTSKNHRLTVLSNAPAAAPGAPNNPQQPKNPRARQSKEYRYVDEVTYTYIGQRERGGKKEAVIKIEGKSVQAAGAKEAVFGEAKGYALVELETGIVVEASIEKELEIDTSAGGVKKHLNLANRYKLERGSSN